MRKRLSKSGKVVKRVCKEYERDGYCGDIMPAIERIQHDLERQQHVLDTLKRILKKIPYKDYNVFAGVFNLECEKAGEYGFLLDRFMGLRENEVEEIVRMWEAARRQKRNPKAAQQI